MNTNEFIEKLKLYDSKIIEAVQFYILIERIADWYEAEPSLNQYIGFLGPACESLKYNFYMHFTALFDGRSQKDITKLIHEIKKETWYNKKLDSIYDKYCSIITRDSTNMVPCIKAAVSWRDSFLAHYDDEAVDLIAFTNLQNNEKIDLDGMLDLLVDLHNDINYIFNLFALKKRKLLLINYNDIDLFFMKFLGNYENIPLYSFDINIFLNK